MEYDKIQKKKLWKKIDKVMQRIPGIDYIVIVADMNGYVENYRTDYDRVHTCGMRLEKEHLILH